MLQMLIQWLTHWVVHETGPSQSEVWCTLHEQQLSPFHVQHVERLQLDDNKLCLQFCQWHLQKAIDETELLYLTLWTNETTFTKSSINHLHSLHERALEKCHATWHSSYQQRFSIEVWIGTADDYRTRQYVTANHFSRIYYTDLLERTLPLLLDDAPLNDLQGMRFQDNSTPPSV
jgi:hypothetical protein